MKIRFYVDPETDEPHIHNHDVDEQEVADVLANPGEDRAGREGSRVVIGRTRMGGPCGSSTSLIPSLPAFS